MKKLLLLGIPLLALVVALGVGYHFVVDTSSAAHWYTQVDNARVQPLEQNASEYEYRLDAYDENGGAHDVTFGTGRQLRDGAYLELETMPLRGVISWEEVQPDAIPAPARAALGA